MLIQIQIPNSCNLLCPYCYAQKNFKQLDVDKWIAGLEQIPRGTQWLIGFGEPTFDKECMKIIKFLLDMDEEVGVITNLTAHPSIFDGYKKDKLTIFSSYHPYHWTIEEFINQLIAYNGFKIGTINIVAYPPQIKNLKWWINKLNDAGFNDVCILPFGGTYEGKLYPISYTEEQKAEVYGYVEERVNMESEDLGTLLDGTNKKQRYCNAGKDYLYISPDGRCHACSDLDDFGSIFGEVKLNTKAELCPYEQCICFGRFYLIEGD